MSIFFILQVKTDLESVLHNLEEPKLEEKLLVGANGQLLEKSLFVEERAETGIANGGQIHSVSIDVKCSFIPS